MGFILVVDFRANRSVAVSDVMNDNNFSGRVKSVTNGDTTTSTYFFKRKGWADKAVAKLNAMHGVSARLLDVDLVTFDTSVKQVENVAA